ncbi:complex I NDUFA9 subunit family protein [Sphingomonas sp. CGMCC 1.13654]|uniref:Complex I NDUFA9 subunit family protein n=1 Tax=Sphingomonas chungangi TaxID=2683589 RepID=A0A838LCG6_9SPHN|nr:complex I NDUFA9 subunit family protein [Sphingomonas chungangi]MBA2936562.1 complex I NDUFA9 subunit family protein [Sphingomonas chungangi]MVW55947.1 NAD(P)H-binding protein [Sphingomonas chungangi]
MTRLVTVFGGGGFLGRYVAQALLQRGARVRIVERDPKRAFFVKPLGGLGQTQFIAADVTKRQTVERAVQGSDAVINLVGIMSGDFQAVQVDGARNVADAAKAAGATAMVHVSAIGGDAASDVPYARTKGEGETAVQAAFEGATIIRPSILFGSEDEFINRFAAMIQSAPAVPIMGAGTKFQPVFVADVAKAIAEAALAPETYGGASFELGGPEVLTMGELVRRTAAMIGATPTFLDLPDALSGLIASFGFLPGAPITKDQWRMLQHDNIVTPGMQGLTALGVQPTPLGAVAPSWLVRYRRQGRFGAERKAF